MKVIRNTSMQGLTISFGTPEGVKNFFLTPKQQIEVPSSWKSRIAENLVHRRMVKLTHIPDPTPSPVVQSPPTKRFKSPKSN